MLANYYLTFSDSAKYAEAAKNFLLGQGLTIHHSFFASGLMSNFTTGQSLPAGFPPLTSLMLMLFFRIFGASDFTIFMAGTVFFIFIAFLIYLIGRVIGQVRTGVIAVLLFLSSLFFYDYAYNFTSEILFTFEILLIIFIYLKLKNNLVKPLLLSALFIAGLYTRQQTIFILAAFILSLYTDTVLVAQSRARSKLLIGGVVTLVLGLVMSLIFMSSIGIIQTVNISTKEAPGTFLRNEQMQLQAGESLSSKLIYNIYNFAKSPERLLPSSLLLLFILFLFVKTDRKQRFIKIFTATSFLSLILASSLTLPNARYVHPVLPLVFICCALALTKISDHFLVSERLKLLLIASVILLISLPTIGHFTLDARFKNRLLNTYQPPVYRLIAKEMAKDIPQGHLIITNLDAWAAWYEGLTTMWFPISPNQLSVGGKKPTAEYIVITNYLENDADFALGEWKEVVYSPDRIKNKLLLENYMLVRTFIIPAKDNYQNTEIKGSVLKIKP